MLDIFKRAAITRITWTVTFLTACAIVAFLAPYSVYVMYSAQASARIAAGRPYCVQVASRDNIERLRSAQLLQLPHDGRPFPASPCSR